MENNTSAAQEQLVRQSESSVSHPNPESASKPVRSAAKMPESPAPAAAIAVCRLAGADRRQLGGPECDTEYEPYSDAEHEPDGGPLLESDRGPECGPENCTAPGVSSGPDRIVETVAPRQPAPESLFETGMARQSAPEPTSGAAGDGARYDVDVAAEIVRWLTQGLFDPEYILLFGKLAGGTPFSDPKAYDLMLVVRERPVYDWVQVKRYLRYQMPVRHRKIRYMNLYVLPLSYVESHNTPFLYFSHREGILLYCKDRHYFRRPKSCNFAAAYADARLYYDTFADMGMFYLERANTEYAEGYNLRPAALFTAQAAVYFYHMFFYVYHGCEFGIHDPVAMHERMRTLSSELMLLFDDDRTERLFTPSRLRGFIRRAAYDVRFTVDPAELETHMDRVERMGGIVQRLCELRLERYRDLAARHGAEPLSR